MCLKEITTHIKEHKQITNPRNEKTPTSKGR